jgi:hypothetical protein
MLAYFMAMVWSNLIRFPVDRTGQRAMVRKAAVKVTVIATVTAIAAVLSGCNNPGGIRPSGAPKMLPPEEALVFPPPGGPEIISVVNRTFSNAVQQEIILRSDARTPGQNYLKVELFGTQRAEDTGKDGLSSTILRASSIAREVRSAFPGVAMAMSAEYLQNNYGAFSYASGHGSGDDTCLYAWQQIRSPENTQQGFRNLGRINVTLRLCQSGVSVQQLLSVMYNYTITGSYSSENWNPYGSAQTPAEGVGRSGSPIYPVTATEFPMQPGAQSPVTKPARVIRAQPPVRAPAEVAPQVEPAPPPRATVIIPGPNLSGGAGSRPADVPAPERRIETRRISIPSPDCVATGGEGQRCD